VADNRSDVERYGTELTRRKFEEILSPDRCRSFSRLAYAPRQDDDRVLDVILEVRGLGAVFLHAGPGKTDLACAAFTNEEIQFDGAIDRSFDEARRARAARRGGGDPPGD
jgi:hypothetical protein